ncbi:alpha/beta-hydrolase [Xylariaceae sp. AK1471]|nr:alpha/beta-hydrolase [Xylariaceae sp. AK1471]
MRTHQATLVALTLAQTVLCSPNQGSNGAYLPIVDLDYELHQALYYNSSSDTYKFANIRYAQNPTGDLRFRAPLLPLVNRSAIEDGSRYRACPQAVPFWQAKAYIPISKYSAGAPFTEEAWENDIANASPPPGLLEHTNDKTSEDCLFLDVHVPRHTFKLAAGHSEFDGVPVLVWIHGGGYVLGSKTGHPNPTMNPDGLLQKAIEAHPNGMVFVALNYRLGALGFLSDPEVKADGALNAGLLDQRLALEWIQENIYRFGGDPKRVTLMGESAGGGSALYQMIAYGGKDGSSPFSQVIAQSPATFPRGVATVGSYRGFLETLGVENLTEARQLSEKDVIDANHNFTGAAPPTSYAFGPVVDGLIIPDEVGKIFKSGAFDKDVKVMAAHNSFEGGFFYDSNITTDAEFQAWVARSIPGLSNSDVDYLANVLYPPVFDGSLNYISQASRQMVFWSEAVIDCTFLLANEALDGRSFAYEFSVTPGFHIQDLRYTFEDYSPIPAPAAREVLQQAIVSFVLQGSPKIKSLPKPGFPHWGSEQKLVNITNTGAEVSSSRPNATRCAWWHQA